MISTKVGVQIVCFYMILLETNSFDWCDHRSCAKGRHTICQYPDKTQCPGNHGRSGLTTDDRRALLDTHNELRQKVAQGKQEGQPGASNMMKMHWDLELEMIAQRWAYQCEVGHDICRNTRDGESVGQNAAGNALKLKPSVEKSPEVLKRCAENWFSEVKDFATSTEIDQFSGHDLQNVGHYTQMVWAESTALGCGYVEKEPEINGWFQYVVLICNYKKAGNMIGASIYKKGDAASECPKNSMPSKRFPGLCTGEKDENKDIPKIPQNSSKTSKTTSFPPHSALLCFLFLHQTGFSLFY